MNPSDKTETGIVQQAMEQGFYASEAENADLLCVNDEQTLPFSGEPDAGASDGQASRWCLAVVEQWRSLPWGSWSEEPARWGQSWDDWIAQCDAFSKTIKHPPEGMILTECEETWVEEMSTLAGTPMKPGALRRFAELAQRAVDAGEPGPYTIPAICFCLRLASSVGDYTALQSALAEDRSAAERSELFERFPDRARLAQLVSEDHQLSEVASDQAGTETAGHIVFKSLLESDDRESKARMAVFEELLGESLPCVGSANALEGCRQMAQESPWMMPVVKELERQLVLNGLKPDSLALRPLLIVGPPGTGKSRFARKVGELIGVPTLIIPAAGAHDNMLLTGTARGYGTSRPSHILSFIEEHRVANPLVVVDEIDKVTLGSHWGCLWDSLHDFLEPENAAHWMDQFLLGEADLSRVSWIATANDINALPASLRSRFRIIKVGTPGAEYVRPMLHSVCRELAAEYEVGDSAASFFDDADWRWLESVSKTPRKARRAVEELLAVKLRQALEFAH